MKFFTLLPFQLFFFLAIPAFANVDFAREVLPILSNKCFACHGPDTKKKDLVRLDLEELAKKDLGGYHAIDLGDLEQSELLHRIIDEEDPMPPKDFDKVLSLTYMKSFINPLGLSIKSIKKHNQLYYIMF